MALPPDERGWPHVSTILMACGLGPDLSHVPERFLEPARERGSSLHEAIEADHYGLDLEPSLEAAPFFSAYRKFRAETDHEPIVSEFRVEHALWRYIGRLDRVGWQTWPKLGRRRTLYDWKSGDTLDLKPVARQLAAYRMAWNHMRPAEPIEVLAAVQFRSDGTYRLHRIEDPRAEEVFLAATVVYRAGGGVR